MRSCDRPSNNSARVLFPSSVSKVYSFSTGTQGSSCRCFATSSSSLPSSCSRSCSSLTAACHSSRVPTLCWVILASLPASSPLRRAAGRKVIAARWRRAQPARFRGVARHGGRGFESVASAPALRRSQYREAECLRRCGHACVVSDETVELVANLECSGEMERVEGAHRHRVEERRPRTDRLGGLDNGELRDDSLRLRYELRYCTPDGPYDFDLHHRARELVGVAPEQVAQRRALALLNDELDERRRVDVDQIRSWRRSSSTSSRGRSSFTFAGGGSCARLPTPRRSGIPRASSRANRSSGSTIGCSTATGWPRSVTSKVSPRRTRRRYTLRFCRSSRTPTRFMTHKM